MKFTTLDLNQQVVPQDYTPSRASIHFWTSVGVAFGIMLVPPVYVVWFMTNAIISLLLGAFLKINEVHAFFVLTLAEYILLVSFFLSAPRRLKRRYPRTG
jgi:hypothetical protein